MTGLAISLSLPGSRDSRRASTCPATCPSARDVEAPPATTATTKPPATASTSHRTTATLAKSTTEADAKGACGSDPIVWPNTYGFWKSTNSVSTNAYDS